MIKICGLHQPADLEYAKNLGADVLGMIYGVEESPRNNTKSELFELFEKAGDSKTALLFRNAELNLILDAINEFSPSIIHLCGAETTSFRDQIKQHSSNVQIWQSYGIDVGSGFTNEDYDRILAIKSEDQVSQMVLDAKKSGKTGGTGCLLPIQELKNHLFNEISEIILAGGLNHENIAQILSEIQPKGVDVSSGIESSPGIKDHEKLKKFIHISKSYLHN